MQPILLCVFLVLAGITLATPNDPPTCFPASYRYRAFNSTIATLVDAALAERMHQYGRQDKVCVDVAFDDASALFTPVRAEYLVSVTVDHGWAGNLARFERKRTCSLTKCDTWRVTPWTEFETAECIAICTLWQKSKWYRLAVDNACRLLDHPKASDIDRLYAPMGIFAMQSRSYTASYDLPPNVAVDLMAVVGSFLEWVDPSIKVKGTVNATTMTVTLGFEGTCPGQAEDMNHGEILIGKQ